MSLIAETDFGLSLLREVSCSQTTVISPISIALALSLVHFGARGNSREQLKNALCGGVTHINCTSYFTYLMKELSTKDDNDVTLNIANKVFASDRVNLKQTYHYELYGKYRTSVQKLDYNNGELASKIVNNFVNTQTKGKITEIVGPNDFNNRLANDGLMLINAVYFNGKWEKSFNNFGDHTFFVRDSVSKKTPFMYLRDTRMPLKVIEDFTALGILYKNSKYRLTIVLPNKRYTLKEALQNLTAKGLHELITNKNRELVNVDIPKFKIETNTPLRDKLKKMGIIDAFTEKADFSGMTDDLLQLQKVAQKAIIEVDEKGTTAAAVTWNGINYSSKPLEPISFVADQPFLFVLSYEGHVLFSGMYYG